MKKAFCDLIEFERACGHELSASRPKITDERTKELRRLLINEEMDELDAAIVEENMTEIADGIADLCYVLLGTAVRLGIDLPKIWEAVHAANMAKFGPGSWRDETGKIRKPEGWKHPDISGFLERQECLATEYCGMERDPEHNP